MSEVLRSEDVQAGYEEGVFDSLSENETGKIVQLKQEELSPVNYKTQVLLSLVWLSGSKPFSCRELQVRRYDCGVVFDFDFDEPGTDDCGSLFFNGRVWSVSILDLNKGTYKDSDGKVIRQVVQLKKEEVSSTDQKTTLILSMFSGMLGVHQFYSGKPLKGALMLCTFGGLGFWWAFNVYQIATCNFRDGENKILCPSYIKESHGM